MPIYISGSLAIDRIMHFADNFDKFLLPEKLHRLNVSFTVDDLVERWGGTAGNIAYTLALLGEKPTILATVGKDFGEYAEHLRSLNLSLDGIRILPDQFTSGCYVITDKKTNQITSFYPAAMNQPIDYDLSKIKATDLVIVSPGNLDDMQVLPNVFREQHVPFIYDPGQAIPALMSSQSSGEAIIKGMAGAAFIITNDYELEMILKATKKTRAEIRAMTNCLITTLGEKGSLIWEKEEYAIQAVPPNRIVDPTGCGDSFRAGLLKGLVSGYSLRKSAQLGATCASFCIEYAGTQEHYFNRESFLKRHKSAFDER